MEKEPRAGQLHCWFQRESMSLRPHIFDMAEQVIASGGLVIVPTETFYAIAAHPFQEQAVRRVFHVKGRAESKPLGLIAADRSVVEASVCMTDGPSRALMEHFWPGSLTILLKAEGFSPLLAGSDNKIGVRVPPWCAARILAARTGGWITATSANLSGNPDPDDISKIDPAVIDSVDMVMDLGPTRGGRPSTVVEPLDHGFRIVREGAIEESVIRDFYGRMNMP
jgi:L-threonylcarbamoyladenylate synthase